MSTVEVVYIGHDNTIELLLKKDGVAENLSGATKVEITVGTMVIDSIAKPTAFVLTDMVTGKLVMKLGGQSLAAGDYAGCEIAVFSALYPNGMVWGTIGIRVV